MVFFDLEWPWKVNPGHMFSRAYISKPVIQGLKPLRKQFLKTFYVLRLYLNHNSSPMMTFMKSTHSKTRWSGYIYSVPSHSGNHGKPWKLVSNFSVRENSGNLGKPASCAMCPSCVHWLTGYRGSIVCMQYEYYTPLQTIGCARQQLALLEPLLDFQQPP